MRMGRQARGRRHGMRMGHGPAGGATAIRPDRRGRHAQASASASNAAAPTPTPPPIPHSASRMHMRSWPTCAAAAGAGALVRGGRGAPGRVGTASADGSMPIHGPPQACCPSNGTLIMTQSTTIITHPPTLHGGIPQRGGTACPRCSLPPTHTHTCMWWCGRASAAPTCVPPCCCVRAGRPGGHMGATCWPRQG